MRAEADKRKRPTAEELSDIIGSVNKQYGTALDKLAAGASADEEDSDNE